MLIRSIYRCIDVYVYAKMMEVKVKMRVDDDCIYI